MNLLVAAIHGILTGQTQPSWPDKFDAWMARRDPEIKVLKKEYFAGPFPRWNCWVRDPRLARALANEIELFALPRNADSRVCRFADCQSARPEARASGSSACRLGNLRNGRLAVCATQACPPIWLVAHSNGAVIALLVTKRLIARGYRIGGLILTGAACEADVNRNGVLDWWSEGTLGAAWAYSSPEDAVVAGDGRAADRPWLKLRDWLWGKLMWPYGSLGRTGWTCRGYPLSQPNQLPTLSFEISTLRTRWFRGGHSTYFTPEHIDGTFEQMYQDMVGTQSSACSHTSAPAQQGGGSLTTPVSPTQLQAENFVPGGRPPLPGPRLLAKEEREQSAPLAGLGSGLAGLGILSQIPTLPPGAIETWLLCAMALGLIVALGIRLFVRRPPIEAEFVSKSEFRPFREGVERDLNGLRDRLDARFLSVVEKIDEVKAELLSDGERRANSLHHRLNEFEAGLARVDERTRRDA